MKPAIQHIKKELSGLYDDREIKSFTRLILEEVCGISLVRQTVDSDLSLTYVQREAVMHVVERLRSYEPIQYIFGHTEFYGLKIKTSPSVLIPRPETEELIEWISEGGLAPASYILDIGTGSGCIALALKKVAPASFVTGVDISDEALALAKENAMLNRYCINFIKADILKWSSYTWHSYDIIVSNPPYVRMQERTWMRPNVLRYEPGDALFVSDSDPLLYYRHIANFGQSHLRIGGRLYFEINEAMGDKIRQLLDEAGYEEIEFRKDLSGKLRMVRCRRSFKKR